MVVGMIAILKAGGATCRLTPAIHLNAWAFMVADTAMPLLITQELLMSLVGGHSSLVTC